jgi:hypothetical protein
LEYLTSSFEDFKTFVQEQFVPACESRGLQPLLKELDTNKLAAVRSQNGVKTEVKLIRGNLSLIAGYGNSPEERDVMREELAKHGRECMPGRALLQMPYRDLDDYFLFLEQLEEIDAIAKATRASQYFTRSYDPLMIANRYFYAVQNKDQDLINMSRTLLSADGYDSDIAINKPSETRTYREHVVPCIKIHTEIMRRVMLTETTPEAIAQFIKDNLKIAYISVADRQRIDFEYKWLTDMPKDWNWGDNITARLDETNTKY